jgi:type I restriction enzyme S subunit
MKEGWEYKKIKDIGSVIAGTTPNTNIAEYWDGNLCWISPAELDGSHYLYDSRKKITESAVKAKNLKLLPEGTVILSSRAPIGKVVINKVPTYCNQGFKCVVCGKEIYNEFLYWWFWGKTEYLNSLGTGATFKEISKKVVEEILIPVPPLFEQQSIVDYLDSAFAKIDAMKANAEKALNEAKALFQASLKEMLEPKEDVKWSTIGDLFETYSGGTPTKSNKDYYEGGSIPWLRSGEVCQKEITRTEMFITEKGLKESSAKYYPENTVVVAMYGATAAQVGILRIKSTSNQAVCGILPHKDFLPEFVYYWFSSIEDKLAAQAQGGAQPNISQQKIKKVEIPIYSITEQQSIVETLDSLKSKVDRLQENYDKISQECDALKQAILRKVFE